MSYKSREDLANHIANMSPQELGRLLKSHYCNEGTFRFAREITERVNYCQNAKDVRSHNEELARETIFSYLGVNYLSLKLIHLGIVFADEERYQDLNTYFDGDKERIAYEMKTTEQAVECKQLLDEFVKSNEKPFVKKK